MEILCTSVQYGFSFIFNVQNVKFISGFTPKMSVVYIFKAVVIIEPGVYEI